MNWIGKNQSALQLLAVALTLGLATFAAVEDDLPSWFGYLPFGLSIALGLLAAGLLVAANFAGEARYIPLIEAARDLVPRLPSNIRDTYGRMLSHNGILTADLFANMISQLEDGDRPIIFGRADENMRLEEIPAIDFEATHEVTRGSLRLVSDGSIRWRDLHIRRKDCRRILKYYFGLHTQMLPPKTGGPRIRRL